MRIWQNIALADTDTGTQTGTVGEASAAASSSGFFLTGNWYASRSADAGTTWTFVDPFTAFPGGSSTFCCDQRVLWAPRQKLWVWLLQYTFDGSSNTFRIAVSADATTWRSWVVAPTDLDRRWRNAWFDYPDLALSDGHLWVSFNQFSADERWLRATVLRYPLDGLAAFAAGTAASVPRAHWRTNRHGSLRFVVGAGDTMWWASTDAAEAALHVFAWADAAAVVESWVVPVALWDDGDYAAPGPGNSVWLSRADDRITGGWRLPPTGTTATQPCRLGWLWTSGRHSGRPHPYVRAVVLAEDTLRVLAQPDLWSASGAWAYPAAAPSARGRVGLTAFYGSGAMFPAHVVGTLAADGSRWTTRRAAVSTHPPQDGKWGDYLTIAPHPRRPASWVAAGYTLQGGQDRRNIEPRVVVFGP